MVNEKEFLSRITVSRVKWFLYYTFVKDLYVWLKIKLTDNWLRAIQQETRENHR